MNSCWEGLKPENHPLSIPMLQSPWPRACLPACKTYAGLKLTDMYLRLISARMIESKSGRSAPPYPRNVGQFRFDVVRERLSGATVAAAADEEEEEEDAGVVDDNDSDE